MRYYDLAVGDHITATRPDGLTTTGTVRIEVWEHSHTKKWFRRHWLDLDNPDRIRSVPLKELEDAGHVFTLTK
ncbi:MAG: hypothetical protein ACTHZ9_11280 [Leucobacter sp.]